MKTLGLRHVALRVRNVEISKKFYMDFFGMDIEWEPDDKNIFLTTAGRDNLALHETDESSPDYQPRALDHIGFFLKTPEEVDVLYAEALNKKIPIQREIKRHRDGAYSFYLSDPDGYIVQVIYHKPVAEALTKSF